MPLTAGVAHRDSKHRPADPLAKIHVTTDCGGSFRKNARFPERPRFRDDLWCLTSLGPTRTCDYC